MPSPTIKLQQEQLKEIRKLGASFNSLSSFLIKSDRNRSRLAEENALEAERLKKITSISTPDGGTRPPGTSGGGGLGLGSLGLLAAAGGLAYLYRDEIADLIKGFLGIDSDKGLFPLMYEKLKEEIGKIDILDSEGGLGKTIMGITGLLGLTAVTASALKKDVSGIASTIPKDDANSKDERKKKKGKFLKFLRGAGWLSVGIATLDAITNYAEDQAKTNDKTFKGKFDSAMVATTKTLMGTLGAFNDTANSIANMVLKAIGVDYRFNTDTADAINQKTDEKINEIRNNEKPLGTQINDAIAGMFKKVFNAEDRFGGGYTGPQSTDQVIDPDGSLAMAGVKDPLPTNYDLSNLVNYVKGKEGFKAESFYDYGQYSQGYGLRSTRGAAPVTEEVATEKLLKEIAKVRDQVITMTTEAGYNFNDAEIDALTSFAYNVGVGKKGQVGGLANLLFGDKGDVKRTRAQIADKILQYNKAGGQVLAGLTKRRGEEALAFINAGLLPELSNVNQRQRESTSEALQDFAYQNSNLNYVKADDQSVNVTNNYNGGGGGGSDNNGSPSGSDMDNLFMKGYDKSRAFSD